MWQEVAQIETVPVIMWWPVRYWPSIFSLAFSPDSRHLVVGDEGNSQGGRVGVYRRQRDGTWVLTGGTHEIAGVHKGGIPHPWRVRGIAWRDDTSFVSSCSAFAQLWKLDDKGVFDTYCRESGGAWWLSVHLAPENMVLCDMKFHDRKLVCCLGEQVRIYDIDAQIGKRTESTMQQAEVLQNEARGRHITCSPDGRHVACPIMAIHPTVGTPIIVHHSEMSRSLLNRTGADVQWSHNGRELAVYCYNDGLSVHELNDTSWTMVFHHSECARGEDVFCSAWPLIYDDSAPRLPHMAWSPNDDFIAIADPFVVHIVPLPGTRHVPYQRICLPDLAAYSLAWSADSTMLAIGEGSARGERKVVRIYSLAWSDRTHARFSTIEMRVAVLTLLAVDQRHSLLPIEVWLQVFAHMDFF
jgi:WD40 repeat protein